ncbi:MAG: hypothetical protein PHS49_08045 [Candidatus Gracilibacteria bacterium]|nr:hypothetical protein [Candidatus Gracilibacteria bacterium]
MLKVLIIILVFFSHFIYTHADGDSKKGEKQEKSYDDREKSYDDREKSSSKAIEETKKDFEKRKKELIDDYEQGKITIKEAKNKLEQEKKQKIQEGKKKLEQEKLDNLKQSIKQKINTKFDKLGNVSYEYKKNFYEKIITKIDDILKSKDLSEKEKLLYNILKDVFEELLKK